MKIREKTSKNDVENIEEGSMYYDVLANKYDNLKKIALLFLVLFVIITVLFGYRDIKISGFKYLFKYQSVNEFSLSARYANISHSAGSNASFALYKGDLAVLGEDKLALYRLDDELLHKNFVEENATLAVSEKYLAVYALGKRSLTLYDSFSAVQEISFDFPIGLVTLSDCGSFAVYTKEDGSSVTVFDKQFSEVYRWNSSQRLVLDMALSQDGTKLALLTLGVQNGNYDSLLTVINLQTGKILFTDSYAGIQSVDVEFFTDGRVFVCSAGNAYFYEPGGKLTKTVSRFISYCKEKNKIAFLTSSGAVIYSSLGEELWRTTFSSASGILLDNGVLYVLHDTAISIHKENESFSSVDINAGVLDFFILSDGSVLLCYDAETRRAVP